MSGRTPPLPAGHAPRVAWLSAETPDRYGGGGHRRQYHQIRALRDAGVEVRAATLSDPQQDTSLRGRACRRGAGIGARVMFGEALASGAAVVSRSIGAEGFDADDAFGKGG